MWGVLLIKMSVIYPFYALFVLVEGLKINLMMILVPQALQESWEATPGNSHPGTISKITELAP